MLMQKNVTTDKLYKKLLWKLDFNQYRLLGFFNWFYFCSNLNHPPYFRCCYLIKCYLYAPKLIMLGRWHRKYHSISINKFCFIESLICNALHEVIHKLCKHNKGEECLLNVHSTTWTLLSNMVHRGEGRGSKSPKNFHMVYGWPLSK